MVYLFALVKAMGFVAERRSFIIGKEKYTTNKQGRNKEAQKVAFGNLLYVYLKVGITTTRKSERRRTKF